MKKNQAIRARNMLRRAVKHLENIENCSADVQAIKSAKALDEMGKASEEVMTAYGERLNAQMGTELQRTIAEVVGNPNIQVDLSYIGSRVASATSTYEDMPFQGFFDPSAEKRLNDRQDKACHLRDKAHQIQGKPEVVEAEIIEDDEE